MACRWLLTSESADHHGFTCATCGRGVNFVKPHGGFPNAVTDGDGWRPPESVLDGLGVLPECEA